MNVLHIAPDERFIPFIQKAFKRFPGENRYRFYGVPRKAEPRFVARAEGTKFISNGYWFSSAMRKDVRWCDCLIIHYMHPLVARVALAAPKSVTVVWSGWGGDYSKFISPLFGGLIMPETAKLFESARTKTSYLRGFAKKCLYATLFGYWESRVFPRVDFFSAPIPEDYELLKSAVHGFRADYLQLNYSDMDEMSRGLIVVNGRDILLGNSATPSNNHVEAFNLLRRLDLDGRRIIVPLSYGDRSYGERVAALGRQMFGKAFVPLLEMLPLHEYKEIISKCSVAIMNHRRIQGGGSIVYLLYSGAKLYLDRNNSFLEFFRGRGATVFETPSSGMFDETFFEPLSEAAIRKNKRVLEAFWGRDRVRDNVDRLAQIVGKRREG